MRQQANREVEEEEEEEREKEEKEEEEREAYLCEGEGPPKRVALHV